MDAGCGCRRRLGDLALEVGPVDPTGPVLGQAVGPFGKTRPDRARRPGQVAGNVEGACDDARQVGLSRRIVDRLRHREGPGALGQCSQCLVAHDERGLCDVAGAGHGEVPGQEQARRAHAIAAQLTHDRAQVGGVGGVGTDGVWRGRAEHRGERGRRRDGRPVGRLQVAQRHDVAVALGQVARRVDDEEPGRGVGVGDIELGPGGPARTGPRVYQDDRAGRGERGTHVRDGGRPARRQVEAPDVREDRRPRAEAVVALPRRRIEGLPAARLRERARREVHAPSRHRAGVSHGVVVVGEGQHAQAGVEPVTGLFRGRSPRRGRRRPRRGGGAAARQHQPGEKGQRRQEGRATAPVSTGIRHEDGLYPGTSGPPLTAWLRATSSSAGPSTSSSEPTTRSARPKAG